MKPIAATSAILLAAWLISSPFILAAPPQKPLGAQTAPNVQWQSDLRAAHKLSVAQNKPILVVFGADWCTFCKKLESQTLNTPEVSRYINDTFIPVHLDLDKDKRIGDILEVHALPCTLVLSPNADLLGRIDGFHKAEPFQQKLTAARKYYDTVQTAGQEQGVRR